MKIKQYTPVQRWHLKWTHPQNLTPVLGVRRLNSNMYTHHGWHRNLARTFFSSRRRLSGVTAFSRIFGDSRRSRTSDKRRKMKKKCGTPALSTFCNGLQYMWETFQSWTRQKGVRIHRWVRWSVLCPYNLLISWFRRGTSSRRKNDFFASAYRTLHRNFLHIFPGLPRDHFFFNEICWNIRLPGVSMPDPESRSRAEKPWNIVFTIYSFFTIRSTVACRAAKWEGDLRFFTTNVRRNVQRFSGSWVRVVSGIRPRQIPTSPKYHELGCNSTPQ